MSFKWAADLVNHGQSAAGSAGPSNNINKYNDEKLSAMVNSIIPTDEDVSAIADSLSPATLPLGVNSGKDLYKLIEAYLQGKDANSLGRDETGSKMDVHSTENVINDEPNIETDTEDSKPVKRSNDSSPSEPPPKYQRISDQGKIVAGYYTPAPDERLQDFQATYINIGNPRILKEVIGVRKNTTFMPTGKKKASGDKTAPHTPAI